jgi:integrase
MAKELSSDRGCLSAKPGLGGSRIDYAIQGERGLQLRVSGNRQGRIAKIFSLLYTRKSDGKKRRARLGAYPQMSLAQARAEAARWRGSIVSGADPAAKSQEAKQAPTFKTLAYEWLENHAKRKRRKWYEDQRILNKDILPYIGDLKANSVTKNNIRAVTNVILARGANYHANITYELLRAIYRWGRRNNDFITVNPVEGLDRPSVETPRERKLGDAELKVFWNALDDASMWEGMRDILRLCLILGQRVNEIAQAPKIEFDADVAMWTISQDRTKNGRPHRLPVPTCAAFIIKNACARKPDSKYVFPTPRFLADKPMTESAVSKAWIRARKSIQGLDDLRVHDLRRSFASVAGDAGFDDFQIGLVLNHRSGRSKVTSIYNRSTYDGPKKEVLEAVEAAVLKAIA